MKKKVSLKDVAQHLGVSTALVSYVVNNKEKQVRVSEEMAKKIRKAIIELNYQPNLIAKSLKNGVTNTIGLIIADISNPFFSNIARIIEDEAKKLGYIVIIGSCDENAEKSQALIDVMMTRQVDAFIVSPAADTEKQIESLKNMQVPVVLIDRHFPDVETDTVYTDNYAASYKAVEHLIANGRRKIAMMAYDTSLPHMKERIRGYQEALRDNGIEFLPSWLKLASYQQISDDVDKGIQTLLKPVPKVDAFFFATNSLAVEGLKTITRLKVIVPKQLAFISFDESDAFSFFYSPVTYVKQSVTDIGIEAVRAAVNRIRDRMAKPARILVPAKLIVHESCGSKKVSRELRSSL